MYSEIQNGKKSNELPLNSFLLVVKENHEDALHLAQTIKAWLEEKSVSATIINAFIAKKDLLAYTRKHDIAVILGGDGTILGISRNMYEHPIPLVGINFGKVGFLADIAPDKWEEGLNNLLNGKYQIQNVTPIHFDQCRNNHIIHSGIAMNDVVVSRGAVAKSIYINLCIDDVFLSNLHCDGLICSAPLGATAYAASAHGPLAFPALDAHILTPISPFAGSFPPLVMPKESTIQITSLEDRETYITVDGQDVYEVLEGDTVFVKSAEHKISMFVSDPRWFWKRLGDRGFIMPGPGKYSKEYKKQEILKEKL